MFERLSHLLKREPTFAQALSQVEASAALVALVKSSLPSSQKSAIQACYIQRNAVVVVVNSHGSATKIHAQRAVILCTVSAKLPDCTEVRIQVQANVILQATPPVKRQLPATAKSALARARADTTNEKLKNALQRLEDLAGK